MHRTSVALAVVMAIPLCPTARFQTTDVRVGLHARCPIQEHLSVAFRTANAHNDPFCSFSPDLQPSHGIKLKIDL